jgi:hypothetical protein
MVDWTAVIAILATFGSATAIVWIVAMRRHRERIELIRQGINPDSRVEPIPSPGSKALLWGLVSMAFGISGVIYFIVVGEVEKDGALFFSIFGLVVGVAMLLYYRMQAPERERIRKLAESMRVNTYSKLSEAELASSQVSTDVEK